MGIAMAAWTWRTWPDILIDFGREAYVAWRLTEGDVLHRDVVYVSGPLSPYWNALWFRVFGVGLDTLFAVNAIILGSLVVLWFGLLRRAADRLGAWVACAVFLTLFGFAQYVGIGNYNFMAPYSHELPHGLLLATLGLVCWERIARGAGLSWAGAAGVALGLVALTKIEVFAAAALANGVIAFGLARRDGGPATRPRLLAFAVGGVSPIIAAVLALSASLGFEASLRAVGVAWLRLFGDDLAALPFYQRGLGTDDLGANLGVALLWAGKIGLLFVPAFAAASLLGAQRFRRPWVPFVCGALMAAAIAGFDVAWLQAARALPLFAVAGLAFALWRLAQPRDDPARTAALLHAMLFAFATAMLAKIFFHARIYQYGFALALPATLLLVTTLVSWIPAKIEQRGGYGAAFRGAALGVVLVAIIGHLQIVAPYVAKKSSRLGGIDDAIRVAPVIARVLGTALEEVQARTRPGEPLTVMPEGVMLNFLARRPLPTPHFSFNPFEVLIYGEDTMVRAFEASPPAAVVLVHHDTSEHGARFLGRNYGIDLLAWIREHYRTVRQIGDPPLEPGTRFGVQVLEAKRRRR
ncbi:MAG: hypothetical protein VCC19_17340 [Myxococcota bacterium]